MKTLFVRILPKSGPESFFRCAMRFTREWVRVEVDDATTERLEAEQMLECTDTEPEGFVRPDDGEAAAAKEAVAVEAAAKDAADSKTKAKKG